MTSNFVYDAPQFVDFATVARHMDFYEENDEDRHKLEEYFEIDHENPSISNIIEMAEKVNIKEEECFYSPLTTPATDQFIIKDDMQPPRFELRKSLSTSCLPQSKKEKEKRAVKDEKPATRRTMRSRNNSTSSTSSDWKARMDDLSKPKYSSLNNVNKYISMNEAIDRYYKTTPDRCRSRSKLRDAPKPPTGPLANTIPQSPMLQTKNRHRSMAEVMTREQLELKQFDEARKFKIKANPVNQRILKGPMKVKPVEKKPATEIVPFKITEVHKKIQPSPKKDTSFHANPVPKCLYEPFKPLIKHSLYTEPITPSFMKKQMDKVKQNLKQRTENKPSGPPKPFIPTRTKPVPFSFDQRDKSLPAKKERFIQNVIEEEKRNREFHARPLPKDIFSSPKLKPKGTHTRHSSCESLRSTTDDKETYEFKARPAKVLHIEPFIPKKSDRPLLEVDDFQLNTDRRAKEREEFDEKLRHKEEAIMLQRQMREDELFRMEQEEIARLRKEAEHIAQPIRSFKAVQRITPKKVTDPVTPKLSYRMKNNKENIA